MSHLCALLRAALTSDPDPALTSAEGQRFLWDNWRWIAILFVLAVFTTALSEE